MCGFPGALGRIVRPPRPGPSNGCTRPACGGATCRGLTWALTESWCGRSTWPTAGIGRTGAAVSMVGFVRRRRLSAVCVFGALLVADAACGTPSGSHSAATSPPATSTGSALAIGTATSNGAAPPAEPTGLESAGPSGSRVSVSYATLPVGGSHDFQSETECVTANWLGGALSGGMTVAVAGVTFSQPGFVRTGGCGSHPECAPPFTFTSDQLSCSVNVHVVTKKPANATMQVVGTPHCTAAAKSSCATLRPGPGVSLTWTPPSAPPSSSHSASAPPSSSHSPGAPPSSAPKSVAPQGSSS